MKNALPRRPADPCTVPPQFLTQRLRPYENKTLVTRGNNGLQEHLSAFSKPTVWEDAPFELNESIFGGLLKAADQADFAVFVFDADDVTRTRHSEVRTVRDNVVFEFGLFTGQWGKGGPSGSALAARHS